MAAASELQGKYQKLAQEYSKLRAQNQVLKKGVMDEQANSAALKEQMKMKDQSLRKLQQEMDSLTFRNQQLAKRVELLQDELALNEYKGKKNKKSGDSVSQLSQEQKNVFGEDLQKKIEENERLHIQMCWLTRPKILVVGDFGSYDPIQVKDIDDGKGILWKTFHSFIDVLLSGEI